MHREAGGGWYHLNLHFDQWFHKCMIPPNERSVAYRLKPSCGLICLLCCIPSDISLWYYTLLHLILINYCGTGCIRRLGNYSKSIKLVQNTHWILQHIKSCSTWFRQSISWIQRFRLTQSHCHSLTQPHYHWDWQTESHGHHAAGQLSCLWPGPWGWAWQHCHYVWYLSSDK